MTLPLYVADHGSPCIQNSFKREWWVGRKNFPLRQPEQAVSTGSRLGNEQLRVGAALLDSSYGRTAVDLEFRS